METSDGAYRPFGARLEEGPGREEDDLEARRAEESKVDEMDDDFQSNAEVDLSDPHLSAIDKQYAQQTNVPRRIHILGLGSIGKLVAHSLRSLPQPPPITLLFHRPDLIEAWEKSKKTITIHDNGYDVAREGFDVELAPPERVEHGTILEEGTPSVYDVANDELRPHEAAKILASQQQQQGSEISRVRKKYADYLPDTPIHNLIVTTKAPVTVNALARLKPRLLPTSTITFLQNGMGVIEEVNAKLFPEPTTRPNYAQGINTHGANVPAQKADENPFYAIHAGQGTIALGLSPREAPPQGQQTSPSSHREEVWKWPPTSRYLVRTLTRSPVLCAVGFTPIELLQQQWEKLAVNSVINPLTALMDCRNGGLLYNFAISRTMRLLLAETSQIVRSLPELKNVPNVERRFSPERLETLVVSICHKTRENVSSMLADVRAGRQTEVDFLNGYVVKKGEEVGVQAVVNYAVMQVVKGKTRMVGKENEGVVGRGLRG